MKILAKGSQKNFPVMHLKYLNSPTDIVGRGSNPWVPKPQSLPPWRPGEALALAKKKLSLKMLLRNQ